VLFGLNLLALERYQAGAVCVMCAPAHLQAQLVEANEAAAAYYVRERTTSANHAGVGLSGQLLLGAYADSCMAFAGTLESKKTKPSVAVGCVKIASRSTVYGNPPSIAV
jgi:hypothetical protein